MNSDPRTTTALGNTGKGHRHSKQAAHLSLNVLLREASKVMADLGVHLPARRLHRVVLRYLRTGRGDVDFRTWFLTYADPTGEQAVRNAMRDAS